MTLPAAQRRIVLAGRPSGVPREDDFRMETAEVPRPGPGEVLVRTVDLSLDPYVRGTLTGRDLGHPPIAPGDLVPGRAIARVVDSGAWVVAETGWQEYAAVPSAALSPLSVPQGVPRTAVLGALGTPGLTAYSTVTRMLRPAAGDTVVVSSATGGVGGVAGQLAALAGARAVAIAGGPEKCRIAVEHFGYAAAVDRHDPRWTEALAAACPDGVDGYLHMGGGAVLDAVMALVAPGGRVVLCGLPENSNEVGTPAVLPAGLLMRTRAIVYGFVVYDHEDLRPRFLHEVGGLLAEGRLRLLEDVHEGLESAPAAFRGLMSGANLGKTVVRVAHE
ncbi:MDR family NADP-dependent oxidoreductase [Actinocorallia populi]|uniref:MDR family NADP-dependent oxidoreductase n=1 Tax=Actinocorallia populi TaxID=2079200 RepID=UPI000D086980|nr:NADP-dependent oxidoreductase [Actinocorallia populi]